MHGWLKGTAQTVILHRQQLSVGYLDNPQTKPLMSGVEIVFEGSCKVDIAQKTDFLQNVMKHLDHDTKQVGVFGVKHY